MTAKRPAVTVGIPAFNAERWIASTLRSVFAQSLTEWELIIIDDGSSDSTVSLISRLGDPRIRVVSDRLNRGVAARYNQIVRLARAPYVAMLDHDDLMHPSRLAVQVHCLERQKDLDAVGSSAYVIDEHSKLIGIRPALSLATSLKSVLERGLMVHPSMTARKEWMLKYPYNEHLRRLADFDLWCRVCQNSTLLMIKTPLLYYRDISSQKPSAYLLSYYEKLRLLGHYGFAGVGRTWTALRMANQIVIAAAYCTLAALGAVRFIRFMHNRRVSQDEFVRASDGLKQIFAQELSGLEAAGL